MTLPFQIVSATQTLRAEVISESAGEDAARNSKISQIKLLVFNQEGMSEHLRFAVTIKGLVFKTSGRPSASWQFIPGDLGHDIRPVLRVRLSRGAYIDNIEAIFSRARRAFPPPPGGRRRRALALEIIRIEEDHSYCELGQSQSLLDSAFAPTYWSYITETYWDRPAAPTSNFSIIQPTPDYEPRIMQTPTGLIIEKTAHNNLPAWKIKVTVPLNEPTAFAYNLLRSGFVGSGEDSIPDYDRQHLSQFAGSVYIFRVVKTLNVDVKLEIELPHLHSSSDIHIEYHVVNQDRRQAPVDRDIQLPSLATNLSYTEGWKYIGLVPEQGEYLDPQNFQFYTLSHQSAAARPPAFRDWSVERLTQYQVIGDAITIVGRRPGQRLGRVAPRLVTRYTSELQFAINAFELTIGLVPIIGTVYDVAAIVYLSSHGHSFWGERREITWIDFMAIGGIALGLMGDAASASRLASRAQDIVSSSVSRSRPLSQVLESVDGPLRTQVQVPTRRSARSAPSSAAARRTLRDMTEEAQGTYSTRGQELITRAATAARRRRSRDITALERAINELGDELSGLLSEIIIDLPSDRFARFVASLANGHLANKIFELGEPYVTHFLLRHERQRLLSVLSPDFKHFNNDILAQGYRAYASRKHAAGQTAVNMLNWIRRQRSGRYHEQLVRLLGQGYGRRLARAQALGIGTAVNDAAVTAIVRLQNRIRPYSEQVAARTAASTQDSVLGALADADHLLEKRFINHLRTLLPDFDTDSLQALVVPKNQAVLERMRRTSAGRNIITYDHSTKTQLLRAMIPYGEQHLFSLQQWWDAHVWAYRQLPVANIDDVLAGLRTDFDRIASELSQAYDPRTTLGAMDLTPSSMQGLNSATAVTP